MVFFDVPLDVPLVVPLDVPDGIGRSRFAQFCVVLNMIMSVRETTGRERVGAGWHVHARATPASEEAPQQHSTHKAHTSCCTTQTKRPNVQTSKRPNVYIMACVSSSTARSDNSPVALGRWLVRASVSEIGSLWKFYFLLDQVVIRFCEIGAKRHELHTDRVSEKLACGHNVQDIHVVDGEVQCSRCTGSVVYEWVDTDEDMGGSANGSNGSNGSKRSNEPTDTDLFNAVLTLQQHEVVVLFGKCIRASSTTLTLGCECKCGLDNLVVVDGIPQCLGCCPTDVDASETDSGLDLEVDLDLGMDDTVCPQLDSLSVCTVEEVKFPTPQKTLVQLACPKDWDKEEFNSIVADMPRVCLPNGQVGLKGDKYTVEDINEHGELEEKELQEVFVYSPGEDAWWFAEGGYSLKRYYELVDSQREIMMLRGQW